MSSQVARLLGMLILIIELTALLNMRRITVWILRGILVVALGEWQQLLQQIWLTPIASVPSVRVRVERDEYRYNKVRIYTTLAYARFEQSPQHPAWNAHFILLQATVRTGIKSAPIELMSTPQLSAYVPRFLHHPHPVGTIPHREGRTAAFVVETIVRRYLIVLSSR